MEDKQELIWVSKEMAEKWESMTAKQTTRDEQEKVLNDYMETVLVKVREEYKSNLESLEEDALVFTGLMLKVKQAFGKAKDEHLNASYELWEKFEADIPSVTKKTEAIIKVLKPLKDELTEINGLIGKISVWEIDKLTQAVGCLADTYGRNKEMVEFLVKNFAPAVSNTNGKETE
jgi:archaellum component FlaC